MRRVCGRLALFLVLLLSGCATSPPPPMAAMVCPTLPASMIQPLPAPVRLIRHNRDLLQLLADYEAQRLRFNADRMGAALILRRAESDSAVE